MQYFCPKCNAEFDVPEELFDKPLQCSNCQNIFTVPTPEAAENSELFVESESKTCRPLDRKFKRLLITFSVSIVFLVAFFLILPRIIYNNPAKMPEFMLLYAAYVGSPLQRANACKALDMLAVRHQRTDKSNFYCQQGMAILENCEETVPVLFLKIYFKYRGEIYGSCSPEAKRLISLNKKYIINYVLAKYRLKTNSAEEKQLLKEYEQYLVDKIAAEGMTKESAYDLGRIYSCCEFPDMTPDLEKAVYYLEFAADPQKYNHANELLISCYSAQGNYDKLEETVKKYISSTNEKSIVRHLAGKMFKIYCGTDPYCRAISKLPKNYERAVKWKDIAKKTNDSQNYTDWDKELRKAFPEK